MYNTRATDRFIVPKMNTSFKLDSVFEENKHHSHTVKPCYRVHALKLEY